MATATLTNGSMNQWLADGTTTLWDFNFTGGYLNQSTVLAYSETQEAVPVRVEYPLDSSMFVTPARIRITPPIPKGVIFTIRRDSRNGGLPIADFSDGGGISEANLDATARQAIFVSQETLDSANALYNNAVAQAELLNSYLSKSVGAITFPADFGLITDPFVSFTVDLGELNG